MLLLLSLKPVEGKTRGVYPDRRNPNCRKVPKSNLSRIAEMGIQAAFRFAENRYRPDMPNPDLPKRTQADLPKCIFYPESELPKTKSYKKRHVTIPFANDITYD